MAEEQPKAKSSAASIRGIIGLSVSLGLGVLLAFLGRGSVSSLAEDLNIPGLTVFQVTVFCVFLLQYVVFIPCFIFQTERFYDLTGSLTYLSAMIYTWFRGSDLRFENTRATVVTGMVCVWAIRLGSFLFRRVMRDGKDGRFDEIKPNFLRFLAVWSVQGLWVTLTAFAALMVNVSPGNGTDFVAMNGVGLAVWILGFALEIVADQQKSVWRTKPENKGKWIESGLWYYSRHPNYLGEVTLWFGVFLFATPSLRDSQWIAVLSPVFVFCLIYFVSGVSLLEIRADKKWGDDPDYQRYKKTTSVFLLLPKGSGRYETTG